MRRSSAATDCQHSGEVLNEGGHDGNVFGYQWKDGENKQPEKNRLV